MGRPPAIRFANVSKIYPRGLLARGSLRALDGITFAVAPGQIFGLVGPNRAGKTTLVKLLLGLTRPSSGRVERLGHPATDRATLARVGYVHESPAFPRYLTATDFLEYYGALSLLPEPTVKERVRALLERVGLADRARERIATFSKGMLQRLGIAQALLAEPELLVLDEPGEGLDLGGRELIRGLLREQQRQGRTVLLVSHLVTEVEQLCDALAVVVGGHLVFQGSLTELVVDKATNALRPLETVLQTLYSSAPFSAHG